MLEGPPLNGAGQSKGPGNRCSMPCSQIGAEFTAVYGPAFTMNV